MSEQQKSRITINISELLKAFGTLRGMLPRVAEEDVFIADWQLPDGTTNVRGYAKVPQLVTKAHQYDALNQFIRHPQDRHLVWISGLTGGYTPAICLAASLVYKVTKRTNMNAAFLNCNRREITKFIRNNTNGFFGVIVLYGITQDSDYEVKQCARDIVATFSGNSPVIFVGDGCFPSTLARTLGIPYTALITAFKNKAEVATFAG